MEMEPTKVLVFLECIEPCNLNFLRLVHKNQYIVILNLSNHIRDYLIIKKSNKQNYQNIVVKKEEEENIKIEEMSELNEFENMILKDIGNQKEV